MSRRYFDDHGTRWFQPGDLVTRDGTDIHVVVDTNGCEKYAPDGMTVRCTKEPLGYLNDDGTRGEPWTKIGEDEFNTCRRYEFIDPAIEALAPPLCLSDHVKEDLSATLIRNTLFAMILQDASTKKSDEIEEARSKIFSRSFDLYCRINGGPSL